MWFSYEERIFWNQMSVWNYVFWVLDWTSPCEFEINHFRARFRNFNKSKRLIIMTMCKINERIKIWSFNIMPPFHHIDSIPLNESNLFVENYLWVSFCLFCANCAIHEHVIQLNRFECGKETTISLAQTVDSVCCGSDREDMCTTTQHEWIQYIRLNWT